jgi:hypothetical protein
MEFMHELLQRLIVNETDRIFWSIDFRDHLHPAARKSDACSILLLYEADKHIESLLHFEAIHMYQWTKIPMTEGMYVPSRSLHVAHLFLTCD